MKITISAKDGESFAEAVFCILSKYIPIKIRVYHGDDLFVKSYLGDYPSDIDIIIVGREEGRNLITVRDESSNYVKIVSDLIRHGLPQRARFKGMRIKLFGYNVKVGAAGSTDDVSEGLSAFLITLSEPQNFTPENWPANAPPYHSAEGWEFEKAEKLRALRTIINVAPRYGKTENFTPENWPARSPYHSEVFNPPHERDPFRSR